MSGQDRRHREGGAQLFVVLHVFTWNFTRTGMLAYIICLDENLMVNLL